MSPDVRQEPENIHARPLVRPVLIALATGIAGLLASWALTPSTHLHDHAPPVGAIDGVDRDPIESTARGQAMQRDDRARLERWEWVDREHGVANMPIDRAIDLVIARENGGKP